MDLGIRSNCFVIRTMSSFDCQTQDISQKNDQDERRRDLTFSRLGDVLMEIANQSEIHSTAYKQLSPIQAKRKNHPTQASENGKNQAILASDGMTDSEVLGGGRH